MVATKRGDDSRSTKIWPTQDGELIEREARPDSTFSAVHHERRLEDLVLRASALRSSSRRA
jgi:hypothetical protein